jgi:hypothetical protein
MATNPASTETKSPVDDGAAGLTSDVRPSGSGYRAVITRAGRVIWSCPHVHFTEHSARNCPTAAQRLAASL